MLHTKYQSSSPYVWDKTIFKNFLLSFGTRRFFKNFLPYLYVKSEDPQKRTYCHSTAIILSILVESHYMMLHAKYESSSPYGLGQEDFKRFPSLSLCEIRELTT